MVLHDLSFGIKLECVTDAFCWSNLLTTESDITNILFYFMQSSLHYHKWDNRIVLMQKEI